MRKIICFLCLFFQSVLSIWASNQEDIFPFDAARDKAYQWLEKPAGERSPEEKPMVLSVLLYDFMLKKIDPKEAMPTFDALSLDFIQEHAYINLDLHNDYMFLRTLLNFPSNAPPKAKEKNALARLEIINFSRLNFESLDEKYNIKHERFRKSVYFLGSLKKDGEEGKKMRLTYKK